MRTGRLHVVDALCAAFLAGCSLASCSGGGSPPAPGPSPASITTFSGSAASGSSVTLSWTGSSQFTVYRVFRNGGEIATVTTTSFTDTGLAATTAYDYQVRGEGASGLSAASPTITVATLNMLTLVQARLVDAASRSDMLVRDIEFDAAGNIVIAGGAFSANFPTTAGAYDRTFASGGSSTGTAGASDAFVMKVSRTGQILWSTLIGGPNHDRAYGIEIAPDGGVIIAGRAGEGFPTTAGVVQTAFAGDTNPVSAYGRQDGFIAKLSADGSTLLWSTYFGDSRAGFLRDVGVDGADKVYVAGVYYAGLAHITGNARQASPNGQHDLVYARLNATATAVEYGTYLGGNEPAGQTPGTPSIVVTSARDVFLAIDEGGTGAPTTASAYQRNNAGGKDLLLARFSAGDQLVYATYLGGAGEESLETHNIAADPSNRLVIAAMSASTNYPTTLGAYQQSIGGATDGVVSILSADGSALSASTYFGGAGQEDIQGVKVAPNGLIFVSGGTGASSLRTTANAFQRNFAGLDDVALAAFLPDLKATPYLTYLGGSDRDGATAVDIASDGAVAIGGQTASSNFPISVGGSTAPNGANTGWTALFTP